LAMVEDRNVGCAIREVEGGVGPGKCGVPGRDTKRVGLLSPHYCVASPQLLLRVKRGTHRSRTFWESLSLKSWLTYRAATWGNDVSTARMAGNYVSY
jgi:hypothetical protein